MNRYPPETGVFRKDGDTIFRSDPDAPGSVEGYVGNIVAGKAEGIV